MKHLLLTGTLFFLAPAVRAQQIQQVNNGGVYTTIQDGPEPVLAESLAAVSGMHYMKGGRWIAEVSPGLWSGKLGNLTTPTQPNFGFVTENGWMLSAAIKRELSAHWGVGLLFGLGRQTGTGDLGSIASGLAKNLTTVPGGAGFAGGQTSGTSDNVGALTVTWDYAGDPDAFFHLPISVGPLWANQEIKFSNSFINPNTKLAQTESADLKRSYPGLLFNVSLDFLLWKKVALMPSFLAYKGFVGNGYNFNYLVTQNGVTTPYPTTVNGATPFYGNGQLAAMYRPWGLTFNYTLPIGSHNNFTLYSLKWSHAFDTAKR